MLVKNCALGRSFLSHAPHKHRARARHPPVPVRAVLHLPPPATLLPRDQPPHPRLHTCYRNAQRWQDNGTHDSGREEEVEEVSI